MGRRLSLCVLLCCCGVYVGCGCVHAPSLGPLDRVQPISDRPRAGNVYLLRGFLGIFSRGIDRLTTQVNENGVRAHVYQDEQWQALARRIRDQYGGAARREPLILVGHSYGADDAIRVARLLDEANIRVDLLVTLDPVTPPTIPPNVVRCVNIYRSNGMWDTLPFIRGVSVQQGDDHVGSVVNYDIRTDRKDLLEPFTGHFNIEERPKIHDEVLRHVLAACPPRPTWLAGRDAPQRSEPMMGRVIVGGEAVAAPEPRQAAHRLGN